MFCGGDLPDEVAKQVKNLGPTQKLTQKIKDRALELGFEAVGVAPVSAIPAERLQEWLQRGYHGKMTYMERHIERRLDPSQVLEGACSILSLALNYYHPYQLPYSQPDRGAISRYASGTDYHSVLEEKLREMMETISRLCPEAKGRIYVDTGPVMDKYWATQSGIGWLGKHTNVLARELGSWFFLGEILLDIPLHYDEPGWDFCGSCTRCIEACPTEAIIEPYLLDSQRCISYLTIELREDVPETLRPLMDNLIFGCDICQDVCPWNRKAPPSKEPQFRPRRENHHPDLRELARLSVEEFRRRFRGSPIKRAKWSGFMRNVAVAMGNSGDPKMIPELTHLLDSEDSMIRRHAAWALARIGTPQARQALRRRIRTEDDPDTLESLQRTVAEMDTRLP